MNCAVGFDQEGSYELRFAVIYLQTVDTEIHISIWVYTLPTLTSVPSSVHSADPGAGTSTPTAMSISSPQMLAFI